MQKFEKICKFIQKIQMNLENWESSQYFTYKMKLSNAFFLLFRLTIVQFEGRLKQQPNNVSTK